MNAQKNFWGSALPVAVALSLIAGCAQDEGPIYIPPDLSQGFDTVSFKDSVLPVFTKHCWVCHPPSGSLDLSVANAYNNLVNVTSVGFAPEKRVVPGNPMSSVLWQKVVHSGQFGLNMPPNAPIPSEELQTIRDWIEQGAMDN